MVRGEKWILVRSERWLLNSLHDEALSEWRKTNPLTLVDLHLCDSLPAVHGHKPRVALSPTAQVKD